MAKKGRRSGLDAFGGDLWGMTVLESDGTFQHLDVLRIGGTDEVTTGLNVVDHGFDDLLSATRGRSPGPCAECRACPAFDACGGGYLPHRFDGVDYDRPSVHCDALFSLVAHAHAWLRRVTPAELWTESTGPRRS